MAGDMVLGNNEGMCGGRVKLAWPGNNEAKNPPMPILPSSNQSRVPAPQRMREALTSTVPALDYFGNSLTPTPNI
jgi:hypothetical protein